MTTHEREFLYFSTIKESRGDYYVEYSPPVSQMRFATMNVVYPGAHDNARILRDMKTEVAHWLGRYPVPIMASAWDAKEDLIYPHGDFNKAHIYAWHAQGTKDVVTTWDSNNLPDFFKDGGNQPDWRTIYPDIPVRTDAQVKADAHKHFSTQAKHIRILKIVFVFWFAVIPASLAIIQYLGPEWLGLVVLIYSLWQALKAWRKLMGYSKPSKSEEEKADKERKMAHYFYHCERNPEAFSRLLVENLTKDASERVKREAEDLAKRTGKNPS